MKNTRKEIIPSVVPSASNESIIFIMTVALAFIVLIGYARVDNTHAENLFAKSSFYFFNGMIVTWVYCLYDWRRKAYSPLALSTKCGGLLFALLLTLIVWFGVEHSFKVLSDEANLMAISQSLTFDKTAYNHTMGRWYYDNFWPIANQIDKRPILFSYLLHFFHVILGYSITNVFLLNSILLFLFLYLVFILVYPIGGFLGGLAGMFFVLAQPILSITAISGGFDLLACVTQIWVAYLVLKLCQKDEPTLRPLIWYTLILLVHTRYENMLAFPIVIGCLWYFGKFPLSELKKHPYLYSLSSLFLLPRIWQLMMPQNYENPPGIPVIGWINFQKHLPVFVQNFFNLNYELPYATVLNIFCLFILLIWSARFLSKRMTLPTNSIPFTLIILAFAFAELCISLSHHFGVFDHPTQARLFLLFIVTLSLSPMLLHWILGRLPSKILLVTSVSAFLFYFPIARENRFVDRPGIYTIRPVGAVDFNWAKANQQMIRDDIRRHLYDAVYVVEDIPFNRERSQLADVFELQSVFERQNTPEYYVRISKVVL